jgi:uncharacterized protein (TIGR02594 family)
MRFVTMGTALALSLATFSFSATAAPAKKAATAKSHAAATAVATKQRAKRATVGKVARKTVRRVRQQTVDLNQDPTEVRITMVDARPQKSVPASAPAQGMRMPRLFASSDPVEEARRWIGTNPTDMSRLWCARFMNFVLERSGFSGTGSDAAKSFASYGRRVAGPRVGAIAVMTRGKSGGHVGIVSGIDASGNPIVISGNHGKTVGEGVYPRSRILAYVLPQ